MSISFSDAVSQLGISKGYLSRLENDKAFPRSEILRRISDWSNGMVQANDFIPSTSQTDESQGAA